GDVAVHRVATGHWRRQSGRRELELASRLDGVALGGTTNREQMAVLALAGEAGRLQTSEELLDSRGTRKGRRSALEGHRDLFLLDADAPLGDGLGAPLEVRHQVRDGSDGGRIRSRKGGHFPSE